MNENISMILSKLDSYFHRRYESLSKLTCKTYEDFFIDTNEAMESCKINEFIINTLVDYRKSIGANNSLTNYKFKLQINDLLKIEDTYNLVVKENFKYKYRGYPLYTMGSIEHNFVLAKVGREYKIIKHDDKDRFISHIKKLFEEEVKDYRNKNYEKINIIFYKENRCLSEIKNHEEINNYKFKESLEKLTLSLNKVKKEILEKAQLYRKKFLSDNNVLLKEDHAKKSEISSKFRQEYQWKDYNRNAAYEYARKWWNKTNPKYLNFHGLGGDCTNFTSQCVHAGGITMDLEKPYIWKYFSSEHNSTSERIGRSSSWTSVMEFRKYAQLNTFGKGLRAEIGHDLKVVERGDIVQIEDEHSTLVVNNIYKQDQLIDILISSHSDNRFNESLIEEWPNEDFQKTVIKIKGCYI